MTKQQVLYSTSSVGYSVNWVSQCLTHMYTTNEATCWYKSGV